MIVNKSKKTHHSIFSADDFNWCVDNDFQVYLVPIQMNRYKIAVRRGGITTEGKDFRVVDDIEISTKEVLTQKEYATFSEASKAIRDIYKSLRLKYGSL